MNFITRSTVKKYILEQLKQKRPHMNLTRVSAEVYTQLEAEVRKTIDYWIDSHPSIGKTFKPGV